MSRQRGRATDPAHFEVYADAAGEHRWRLVAKNGKTVADSGEGYKRQASALDAVDRIRSYLRVNDLHCIISLRKATRPPVLATSSG